MVDSNTENPSPPQSVLTEISTALKEKGIFEGNLSSQEVEQMMTEIVTNMITDSGKIKGKVINLSVIIEDAKARLQAQVWVSKAFVNTTVDLELDLENSQEKGKIKTSRTPHAFTPSRLAEPYVDKAKQRLTDPNSLIFQGLSKYFAKDGIHLQDMALTLGQDTLGVRLQG